MSLFADYLPDRPGRADERVRVRNGRLADIETLARITAQRQSSSETEAKIRFGRELANPSTAKTLWVAEVENQVIGFGRASLQDRPSDAAPNHPPAGWFLTGVVVSPEWRRRGIGRKLTLARLRYLAAENVSDVYFMVAAVNQASLDLHEAMGFQRLTDDVCAPGVQFSGGRGFLCRLDLRAWNQAQSG